MAKAKLTQPQARDDVIVRELRGIKRELRRAERRAERRDTVVAWLTFAAVGATLTLASAPNLRAHIEVGNWGGSPLGVSVGIAAVVVALCGIWFNLSPGWLYKRQRRR
jgi:hypothetical protein